MQTSRFKVAFLEWGQVWEDFYGYLNISFEAFCKEVTGSWQFGYIEALQKAGVETVMIYFSTQVSEPLRTTHQPTGAKICLLPVPKSYLSIRLQMVHPHPSLSWGVKDLFGNAKGVHWVWLNVLNQIYLYLATPLKLLAEEIKNENCSAILCQEYEYFRFDVCVALGQLLKLPVFASFQGGNSESNLIGLALRPLTMHASAGVIIGTQTEIDRVKSRYALPSRKIAKIFNPINLDFWEPLDRNEARCLFDLNSDDEVVVWHGRINIHTKGLDILLDAWELVCQERKERNLKLMLMGSSPNADQLQERLDSTSLRNIKWINEYVKDRGFIKSFLCAGDVYAFPSRHEGFPVAPIEAMACSIPVVAASAPGIPDIFEKGELSGGVIVPAENVDRFAQALGNILDHSDLRCELGKRARTRVEQYFALEAVGKQISSFMEDKIKS